MKIRLAMTAFAAAFTLAQAAPAADVAAGKEKADQVCASCHGPEGNSDSPLYPRLAGQHADYLLHALRAYKSGKRDNAIMAGLVSGLTERDMKNLAAFYASQDGLKDLSID